VKRYFFILVIPLIILFGCKSGKNGRLYFYNWTYYIPNEVIKDFEKEYEVKVYVDLYSSNEEMFAKLKAGAKGYDLTMPSGDYVSIMIKEDMLNEIDSNLIPNYKYIDKRMIDKKTFDTDNKYSIPFMVGASGIVVNKKYVKYYPRSMDIFLRSDLKGRMSLLDDMREVLGIALKRLGYSVNSINIDELNEAKELILEWKKNIQKFDAEAFAKSFSLGNFWIVQGYPDAIFQEIENEAEREKIDFFIPKEGGTMYMDNFVILKNAKNIENALKFINFIHRPDIYAKILDEFLFLGINNEAIKYRKTTPAYTFNDLEKCEFIDDIGENIELYNTIWESIRIGD